MAATETKQRATPSVARRLHHTIGPIAGGMILDAADLITFGPIGIYGGMVVGAVVGFWLTTLYRFSIPIRLFWSLVAGIYCTVPFTAPFPIATMVSASHRFFH